ncbi:metallothionein-like protein type 2 [Iris pallida]|uniref:Metallothionein-like protein type 2 n=1 Tax=Iris pallida TaxID=29817 RepID=A0AAX6GWH5_IRIPA|nr:metallothionein-like protein type 2 [Iris pallida]
MSKDLSLLQERRMEDASVDRAAAATHATANDQGRCTSLLYIYLL